MTLLINMVQKSRKVDRNKKVYYTVYRTTNLINNKTYIGLHETNNPYDNYPGSGVILSNAIKLHGIENFDKEVLFIFDTKQEMIDKEIELVKPLDPTTYNVALGGCGGDVLTKEDRAIVSEKRKLKKLTITEEHKKIISNHNKGKVFSDEHRKNLSESHKGFVFTKESKEKMRENRIGKCYYRNPNKEEGGLFYPNEAPLGWNKGYGKRKSN